MLDVISEEEAQKILEMKKGTHKQKIEVKEEETEKIPLISVDNVPSGFLGYPEGTKISYEPLTLGELEAMNSSDMDVLRGIAMLLKSIHCNNVKPEDLYYWDVMYIGIQRKLLAFGDTHGIIYTRCPNCGQVVEREFDYTEIEFKECQVPALPVITTINNKEVEISLLTMKEFLEIIVDNGELDVYARMIKNLPYEESFELLKNCYGKDLKKIRYIDKKLDYGMLPLHTTCNNEVEIENPEYDDNNKKPKKIKQLCGTDVIVEVKSPFEVVFPEDTDEGSIDSEIQFGR